LWAKRPNNSRCIQRLWAFERLGILREAKASDANRETLVNNVVENGEAFQGNPTLFSRVYLPQWRHFFTVWDRFIEHPSTNHLRRDVTLESPSQAMVCMFNTFSHL
jgi:hypothetical protein